MLCSNNSYSNYFYAAVNSTQNMQDMKHLLLPGAGEAEGAAAPHSPRPPESSPGWSPRRRSLSARRRPSRSCSRARTRSPCGSRPCRGRSPSSQSRTCPSCPRVASPRISRPIANFCVCRNGLWWSSWEWSSPSPLRCSSDPEDGLFPVWLSPSAPKSLAHVPYQ